MASSVLALLLLVASCWQIWNQHALWRQFEAAQLAILQAARLASSNEVVPALAANDAVRIPSVNAAVRALNAPVPELMTALTAPKDIDVALLGIDLGSEDGSAAGGVRLQADARATVDMTRYLAFLMGRPSLASVVLVQHQLAESNPARPLRFVVEAQWAR